MSLSINCLTLIPTEFERKHLDGGLDHQLGDVELCGFGLVASGIRASRLIQEHRPDCVLLLGIAGSLNDDLQTGEAYSFDHVACYGLGVGCEPGFQTASQMGWKQWASSPEIGDLIRLDKTQNRMLLSCTASSGSQQEADWKLHAYPDAQAEDMEGFAVAAACRFEGVPLTIIRGISNVSGDRDLSNWRVAQAIRSAAELAIQFIQADSVS